MATLFDVRNLEVKYHTRAGVITAVRDISFDVQDGEILGIVGESGCGKSTVASAMMRLLPPNGRISRGQILFKGRDLCTMREDELRTLRGSEISVIFQDPMTGLNPVFDVQSQMLDVLRAHTRGQTTPSLRQRALQMLERVGIPDAAERIHYYPHQFSGGMRQRILIAMALMSHPAVLIADEPTSALDVTLEAQILELIRGLRAELGTAIIYISHDLGVIAQLCDRVVVMYAGQIVEKGDCAAIFRDPRHPYTRALLAAHPSHRHNVERLAAIPGRVPDLTALPAGCRFADRCEYAEPLCHAQEPGYVLSDGRQVLCHAGIVERIAGTQVAKAGTPVEAGPLVLAQPQVADVLVATEGLQTYFRDRVGMIAALRHQLPAAVRAVDGVNIHIHRGDSIGLVGESGSGKTTLGKTILRLVNSTNGRILFDGQDITHLDDGSMRPLRSRMQMIFQDPYSSLSPRMKVSSLLIEPFQIQGIRVDPREKVSELLAMVGLADEQADKYPHELSGGQARRVGVARALALRPEFLVADEPTSGLDVSVAASILNLLKDLREKLGLTYLIISHSLNIIGFVSNRMGVMYLGRLVEFGPTAEIYEHPAHPYTEALLAAISEPDPQMRDSQGRRVLLQGEIPSPKNPPPGCPFHPRCQYARPDCARQRPELTAIGPDHLVACFYPLCLGTR